MYSIALVFAASAPLLAAPLNDARLQNYFATEVETISSECLTRIDSLDDWKETRGELRRELFEMLSLDPLPERTELEPVITGKLEREDIVVEKLHFQSSPGLYVTANFYLPKQIAGPLPTVLYVCGHSVIKTNGISYGNKVGYQHHGAWFACNGYACLTIDTVQLGEIEGIHHGTYREGMWWWNARGYSSAGVEAWNCMRALDYLETRPEVDKTRMGVTGRSGGGAYSWWIAALDDRIQVAAPVAGITDLEDHVVDGVVEGHCDCMYFVNTYRWDYPMVAALVAPRPLLICNSDKDRIFPLGGVMRTHAKTAAIYDLYGASANLGVLITEGPHKDTQDLQLPVFRWFNRHLKKEDPVIEMAATKFFTGQELKVFETLPEDEITSRIHDSFVPIAKAQSASLNPNRREELRAVLKEKCFRGWPAEKSKMRMEKRELDDGVREILFFPQDHVELRLLLKGGANQNEKLAVQVLTADAGEEEIQGHLSGDSPRAVLLVRGVGEGAVEDDRKGIQIRRRYMLVGQTLDGMRVWDMVRGLELLRHETEGAEMVVSADGKQKMNLMVASLFLPPMEIAGGVAENAQSEYPDYLNFLRITSWEEVQALALQTTARSK